MTAPRYIYNAECAVCGARVSGIRFRWWLGLAFSMLVFSWWHRRGSR